MFTLRTTPRIPASGRRWSALLLTLLLLASGLALALAGPGSVPAARAATVVSPSSCRQFDPNLVRGACLRYQSGSGTSFTWIGTYRAANGRIFFCIDYLYDSRIAGRPTIVSTRNLVNQLGDRIGNREVAALNYVISTWARRGSTGSDDRDAAIALIIRELMSDGVRSGGTVVYPRRLEVGGIVQPPVGGLGGQILPLARTMWREASKYYGDYEVRLATRQEGKLKLGTSRTYRVSVHSAAGHRVPGVRVTFACKGPITCPSPVTTRASGVSIQVKPRALGSYVVRARASGPAADGKLYRVGSWHTHGGRAARNAGVQRGWIAQRNATTAAVSASSEIVKGTPQVTTRTSHATVVPGAAIHDVVTVSGLPAGYDETVTATLFGPFPAQPGPDSCAPGTEAGRVTFPVSANGSYVTPSVTVDAVGYYVWQESFPGDVRTHPLKTPCGIVEETTIVEQPRVTPQVTTVASVQAAVVGARIHDNVRVGGIGESVVTVDWTLHGPITPVAGACDDLDWTGAPVVDAGSFTAHGDGTYRTRGTTVETEGCYSYSEHVPGTDATVEASTPVGLPAETVVVTRPRATPTVRTVASTQHLLVGGRVHDTVVIGGLAPGDTVDVAWTLHGPVAPRDGSCDGLDWRAAPVLDSGSFVAHRNGTYTTASTRVATVGCVTYSERLPATGTTSATATAPGVPAETVMVTKPPMAVVPEIPSGGVATGHGRWAD